MRAERRERLSTVTVIPLPSLISLGVVVLILIPSSSSAAYTGFWYEHEPWLIVQEPNQPYYQVGDEVNVTFYAFYNGQPRDLSDPDIGINNGSAGVESLQINNTSTGQYQVSFILAERHLSPSGQFTLELDSQDDVLWPNFDDWTYDTFPPNIGKGPPAGYHLTLEKWPRNRPLEPGMTLTFWANVTARGQPYEPDNVNLSLWSVPYEESPIFLTVEPLATGVYRSSYEIPPTLKEPKEWNLRAKAINNQTPPNLELTAKRLISVKFYQAWTRWLEVEESEAELEVGVADLYGHPVDRARVTVKYGYWDSELQETGEREASQRTNGSGLAHLKLYYSAEKPSFVYFSNIWVNHTYSQRFAGLGWPPRDTHPSFETVIVGGYGNLSGEPWQLVLKPTLDRQPLQPGSNVTVVAFTTQRFLLQANLTTDEEGQIRLDFEPPRCDCPRNLTFLTIYLTYWNGTDYFRLVRGSPWGLLPIPDRPRPWGPSPWDTITFRPQGGHLWLGGPTPVNLTLPANLTPLDRVSEIYAYIGLLQPAGNLGWQRLVSPGVWDPGLTNFDPQAGNQTILVYLPAFLPEDNYTLAALYWPLDMAGATPYLYSEATFPALRAPLPPPPPPPPPNTAPLAAALIFGAGAFATAAYLGGWRRERLAGRARAAERAAKEARLAELRRSVEVRPEAEHIRWRKP